MYDQFQPLYGPDDAPWPPVAPPAGTILNIEHVGGGMSMDTYGEFVSLDDQGITFIHIGRIDMQPNGIRNWGVRPTNEVTYWPWSVVAWCD